MDLYIFKNLFQPKQLPYFEWIGEMFLAALKLKNIIISPLATYHAAGNVWYKDRLFVRVVSGN